MAKLTKTVDEVAVELGVHHLTLRKAIARGEVRAVRIGRRILIPVSELERLLEGRELPAAAP